VTRNVSPCDVAVLDLLAKGAGYELIALDLGVSVNTVKSRLKRLYTKMGAVNSPHAVSIAIGLGLIQPIGKPPAAEPIE
jgi:DNA-binding CsgD family transcriptional regulator